jgi:hypothetical protein
MPFSADSNCVTASWQVAGGGPLVGLLVGEGVGALIMLVSRADMVADAVGLADGLEVADAVGVADGLGVAEGP